jgi:hypothetical protein
LKVEAAGREKWTGLKLLGKYLGQDFKLGRKRE